MGTKLPDFETLAKLREKGASYRTIAALYGCKSYSAVAYHFRKRGLTLKLPDQQWQRFSTALCLLKAERNKTKELAKGLGCSPSTAHYLVGRLCQVGLARKVAGRRGTLRLTEKGQQYVPSLLHLVEKDEDGWLRGLDGRIIGRINEESIKTAAVIDER